MAAVHLASFHVPSSGFSRIVAVKLLHPHFAKVPDVRAMFLDEARIVSHIRHANVVSTLDVIDDDGELVLVMDYVDGPSLSVLLRKVSASGGHIPIPVAVAIVVDMLEGLHAAHEALSPTGEPLGVIHRDVSPQNILVGFDGVARVADFGVAKSLGRIQETSPGEVKGKAGYMAPEQAQGHAIDRRTDVYGAAVVLWEALTATRLFTGATYAEAILKQLTMPAPPPSAHRAEISAGLDAVVLRGLEKNPDARFSSARAMAEELGALVPRASQAEVGAWVREVCGELATERRRLVQAASAEAARAPASESEIDPHVASAATAGALPASAAPSPEDEATTERAPIAIAVTSPARSRPRWAPLALVVVVALVSAAALRSLRAPNDSGTTTGAPAESAGAQTASATASVASPLASAPISPAEEAATPVALPSASAAALPSVAPHGARRRPPTTLNVTSRVTAPVPAPTASGATVQKKCCSPDGLRLRFTDCVDNCPP